MGGVYRDDSITLAMREIVHELKTIRLLLERMDRRQTEVAQVQTEMDDKALVTAIRHQFGIIFDSVDA